jgi:hypothetical protein
LLVVVVVVVLVVIADTLIRILHFRPSSPCFQHIAPLHAALSGGLVRQPCPAALQKSYKLLITSSRPAELQAFLTAVGRHAVLRF